jgi:nucleoside-diphosphate-sugar epimerase
VTVVFNGASGGIGRHLDDALKNRAIPHVALHSRLEDRSGFKLELRRIPRGPVTFIHLAAMVSVPACEANPSLAHAVNVDLAVQGLALVADRFESVRVIYVSTGHVYAAPREQRRVDEHQPVAPRSVYAATKLAGERAFTDFCERRGLSLVIARVFGLLAPGQPKHYVLPALIERVRDDRLMGIPGLDNVRDYLDARDVGDGLLALAQAGTVGTTVVNVCTGSGISIRALLAEVLRHLDPRRAEERAAGATAAVGRADDIPWLVGDPTRVETIVGEALAKRSLGVAVADAVASPMLEPAS